MTCVKTPNLIISTLGIRRFIPMLASSLPPGKTTPGVRAVHLPTKLTGSPAIMGVVLDRPRGCSSKNFARHSHDVDHHNAEFWTPPRHARCIIHEGRGRLDGDLSCLRLRLLHRIFGRERPGEEGEGKEECNQVVGCR